MDDPPRADARWQPANHVRRWHDYSANRRLVSRADWLTLEEGQQLLRRVQVQIIGSQAHAYALCRRPCVYCWKDKRIKDIRTKCVQTVFGAFRFRGRRYRSCGCCEQPDGYRQDFPLGEIIPRRTTPEVRYLFAELGARMPYRAASGILKTCGFGNIRASHGDSPSHDGHGPGTGGQTT
jgi:hypothetical protein